MRVRVCVRCCVLICPWAHYPLIPLLSYLPADGTCAFSSGNGTLDRWVSVEVECGKFPSNTMTTSFVGSPVAVSSHLVPYSNAVQWFDGIIWRGVGVDSPPPPHRSPVHTLPTVLVTQHPLSAPAIYHGLKGHRLPCLPFPVPSTMSLCHCVQCV